jgi:hypothetical protein
LLFFLSLPLFLFGSFFRVFFCSLIGSIRWQSPLLSYSSTVSNLFYASLTLHLLTGIKIHYGRNPNPNPNPNPDPNFNPNPASARRHQNPSRLHRPQVLEGAGHTIGERELTAKDKSARHRSLHAQLRTKVCASFSDVSTLVLIGEGRDMLLDVGTAKQWSCPSRKHACEGPIVCYSSTFS